MKKKSSKLKLPYFFGQRSYGAGSSGNLPELIKPESGWERAQGGIEDILRWADDGGKMLDLGKRTTQSNSNPDAGRERATNDGMSKVTEAEQEGPSSHDPEPHVS
ncbi:MAG TPA: hypothetical protein VFY25_04700 [Anaerolineales bacterium]|nr:hypothetical protein [Anaerolineales bacterium]